MDTLINIATLLTAIAALLAILEMRLQRRGAFKPELFIDNAQLLVHRTANGCFGSTIEVPPTDDVRCYLDNPVRCLNVGVGPAKHIKYSWECDFPSMVESIAELSPEFASKILIEERSVEIAAPEDFHVIYMLPTQMNGTVSIVQSDGETTIPVPSVFLSLFALYVLCATNPKNRKSMIHLKVPQLRLALSYSDLGEFHHSKRFILEPHISVIHSGAESKEGAKPLAQGEFIVMAD